MQAWLVVCVCAVAAGPAVEPLDVKIRLPAETLAVGSSYEAILDVPGVKEGEAVLVNTGTQEVIHLNDSGTFVWENLDGKRDIGAIIKGLTEEFEVDKSTARADVLDFASNLIEKGLITTSPAECDPA